jgi:signal transduction histidine kinase
MKAPVNEAHAHGLLESLTRCDFPAAALELLAQSTIDAVTVWDSRGRCVWASPSVQGVLGHHPSAVLQKTVRWLLPRRRAVPSLAQLFKLPAGTPTTLTVTLPVAGQPQVFEVRVQHTASEPRLLVAVARNIGERLQYERRIHWKQVALEGAEELAQLGIWVWRPGESWEWSPSLGALHGLGRRRPPSFAAYLRSVHPEDRRALERLFRGRSSDEATYRFRRADGVVRTLRLRCRVSPERERVGVVRDITEERSLHENLIGLFNERAQLLREQFTVRDHERGLIAQELHDQLGSSLTALLLTAKRLSGPEAPRQSLRRLARQAHRLLDTVRGVTRTLHVSHLEVLPFKGALRRLVEEYQEATAARLTLEFSGAFPAHAPAGLVRIAQECLTNAVRHAHASRVQVFCAAKAKELWLTVEDDGSGVKARRSGQGMGLSGIILRADAMGGSAHIKSRRGHGTRVEVRVPSLFRGWSSP